MSETIDRRALSDALSRLAFAAELLDDDSVDAKVCTSLAWTIRQLDGDVTTQRIATLDGVNVPLLAVIDDVIHERMPPLLSDLERRLPLGLLEVRRIKGLGPKKIRALWQQLDITSIGELEYACKENRLVELKGFGKKTQDSVLQQIKAMRANAGYLRLDIALSVGEATVRALDAVAGDASAFITGDLRRRTEIVAGVDVTTSASIDVAKKALQDLARRAGFWESAADDDEGDKDQNKNEIGVDGAVLKLQLGRVALRVHAGIEKRFLGAGLILDTGSAEHVAMLRTRAQERGLELDKIDGDENEVYAKLGLVFVEPERREVVAPLIEIGKARPRLVRLDDLRGSLHNHTVASDGDATLIEMRDAAAAHNYEYLAITDHSQSAVYAKGLAASSLFAQRDEVRALNALGASKCVVLSGVESDILKDGALDYPENILRGLDVVIASVHSRFGQKGDDLTARMVAAANNPWSDIVGHPTGRLLLGRAPADYDVSKMLEAAQANGSAVELNANPARLDLNEKHLAEAKERGLLVSIAADAHAVDELDNMEFGVFIARRAGLTVDDVLNSRSLADLMAWLKARRAKAVERANANASSSSQTSESTEAQPGG